MRTCFCVSANLCIGASSWIFRQVPLIMLLVMKGHKVDQMAKKKIGASLVTSMIADYMKATTDAPSTRLATTLGLPPVINLSRLHASHHDFCRI